MVKFAIPRKQKVYTQPSKAKIEKTIDVSKPNSLPAADSSASELPEAASQRTKISRQERQRQMIEHFNNVKQEILDGREFNDQSTPANIFLTLISALYHEDYNLYWKIFGVDKSIEPSVGISPEARKKMLLFFTEKMTISSIPVANKSPKESNLYAIYTGELSGKEISQVWTFGYIEGAWRFLGSTSEIHNWRSSTKQVEAIRRRSLQKRAENEK